MALPLRPRALPAREPFPDRDLEATEPPSGVARLDYRSRRARSPRAYRAPFLLTLALGAVVALLWLAPAAAIEALRVALAWLEAQNTATGRAMITTALVALALLGYVVAWGAASSPRRAVRLERGRGRIAVEEVEARLRAAFLEQPDVRAAHVEVQNLHRRGLAVSATLEVAPQARLARMIDAATAIAEAIVHEEIGVRMWAPPLLDLRYDELDLKAGQANGRRARPLPAAAARGDGKRTA